MRRKDRLTDVPEECDELMKVEPGLLASILPLCVHVKVGPLSRPCVGAQALEGQPDQTFFSMSAFLQKRKRFSVLAFCTFSLSSTVVPQTDLLIFS